MTLRPARLTIGASLLVSLLVGAVLVAASPAAAVTSFADLDGDPALAVVAVIEEGLMRGCAEDEFCPDDAMTRGQLATVLVQALQVPPAEGGAFRDVAGNTHEDNIEALAAAGITSGCAEGRFCPEQPMTRAQMATMLVQALPQEPAVESFFDDLPSVHGGAVDALAAAGIVSGCGDPLTAFCANDPVLRRHAATFIARALELVPRVELTPLAERRAAQAALDEARQAAEQEARQAEAQAAAARRDTVWDALAQCESGGRWSINTGNGYYGGLQFSLASWRAVGGTGYPHQHSREEQIKRGELLQQRQGWGAWPTCSRKVGLR